MAALCEANEERPGSRDSALDSHVLHRRLIGHTNTQKAEIHTHNQSVTPTL